MQHLDQNTNQGKALAQFLKLRHVGGVAPIDELGRDRPAMFDNQDNTQQVQ